MGQGIIKLEKYEKRLLALLDEMTADGVNAFFMTFVDGEHYTCAKVDMNNLLDSVAEIASKGVPVPLLMSAVAFGNDIFMRTANGGKDPRHIDQTHGTWGKPKNDDKWEDVIDENEIVH